MSHCGKRWARVTFVTIVAAVLALVPSLGPVVAANASTMGSTAWGVRLRGDVNGGGFADPTVAVGKDGLVAMHNELLGTEPPYGARLGSGPARVTLIFDLPAQRGFSTVIVTGPDRNQWQAGPPIEDGTMVSAQVRPLGPAGEYTVAWRIVSADGHPVRGTFPFTLTTPGTGTAAAPPPNTDRSGSSTPTTDTGSGGPAVWLWLAGASALLLVAGVVTARRVSRAKG
jgi:methionine-rich copper-binding protein CopC